MFRLKDFLLADRCCRVILLLMTMLAVSRSVVAQVPNATLTITINDSSGGAIPGVQLTLAGGGVERTAKADATGVAVFPAVPAGRYDVLAAHRGFSPGALRGVVVRDGEPLVLVLNLQVARVAERVDVSAPGRYVVPRAESATKTDVPLIETPVSIQVIPQALILDKQLTTLPEVVSGQVSGVVGRTGAPYLYDNFIIRGLTGSGFGDAYRNGLYNRQDIYDIANIDRVEILKGPAAVLYGRIEPGGLINYVTKRPLATRQYSVQQQAGSYQQSRTLFDATGPIGQSGKVLYRFNGSYFTTESFRDFVSNSRAFLAPSLTWRPGSRFDVTVDLEYKRDHFQPDVGLPSIGAQPAALPIERSVSDGAHTQSLTNTLFAFNWTYRLGRGWSITQRYQRQNWTLDQEQVLAGGLQVNNQFQNRNVLQGAQEVDTDSTNLDLLGRFSTGAVSHRILVGLDHFWAKTEQVRFFGAIAPVDIFNPVYGVVNWSAFAPNGAFYRKEFWTGLYVQDQLSVHDRLHLVLGGRFDTVTTGAAGAATPSLDAARAARVALNDEQFSPRVALLYRLRPWVSLYTSYSKSFGANNGVSVSGQPFEPQRGKQYEIGVKTETADKRLSSTVAWFDLTKDNLLTADPVNPSFQILAGEAKSNGVEVDVAGQLSDRFTILTTYANTNARYTRSNSGLTGNLLENVPRHQGSVWGTYDVSHGLRAGLGVTFVGSRKADQANTIEFEGYRRVDAMAAWDRVVGRTQVTLQLNVNNLLDTRYYSSGGSRNTVFPGRPRNAMASVRVGF